MADTKNTSAKIILILTVVGWLLFAAVGADSATNDWTTLTSFKEVRQVRLVNDTLYWLTSGGMLAVADPDQRGREYVNLDGLGTVDVTDMIVDADGQKWITGYGRLIKFDDHNSHQYLFFNNDGNLFRLLCVADDGDQLWVGTELGLVRFSKTADGGQIQDSYTLFGNLNPSPEVYDILLRGDTIFLATSAGLAVGDKSNPMLLKSPANWTAFGPGEYPILGPGTIRGVIGFESQIYVGTTVGMFRLDRGPADTVFTRMPVAYNRNVSDMVIQDDSLFIYVVDAMAVLKDGVFSGLTIDGLPMTARTGMRMDGVRWVADYTGGLYTLQAGAYVEYAHTGASGNDVSDVAVTGSGAVVGGFSGKNPAVLVDDTWIDITHPPSFPDFGWTTQLITDSAGLAWIGTFGVGLWHITPEGSINYDETNSTLRGNTDDGGEDYVVVSGLETDGRYLYVAAYRALDGYPISIVDIDHIDSPAAWTSMGPEDGITDVFVTCLDVYGRLLVVGTLEQGLFYRPLGPDPLNPSQCNDTTCFHYTEDNSHLLSNDITTIKFGPTGRLMVGTGSGLSAYDPLLSRYGDFADVVLADGFGPGVTAIEFDSRDNVWVGSTRGLLRIDAVTGERTHFTNLNSGLVSDNIRNLTFDPFSGNLYISTGSGISVYPALVAKPTTTIDSVYAFPNPFVIRSDEDKLDFNFGGNATVRIFTLAGELVYEGAVNIAWNGRNQGGKAVASGVYLFVLVDDEGNVGHGKFLLVREQ